MKCIYKIFTNRIKTVAGELSGDCRIADHLNRL